MILFINIYSNITLKWILVITVIAIPYVEVIMYMIAYMYCVINNLGPHRFDGVIILSLKICFHVVERWE